MAGDPVVHSRLRAGVATITLDSPHNRNALSAALVGELGDALATATDDDSVRVVVLTATGSTLCSGADLAEAKGPSTAQRFSEILAHLLESPKPVVTRVNGHVRAGGIGIVAASDIVIAPTTASFAFSEVRIGVAPAVIAVACLQVMTPRSLRQLMLTGEAFDATAAMDAGLVTQAVEPDQLDATTETILASLRLVEPNAVAATKALLRTLPGMEVADGLAYAADVSAQLFASPEAAEGIRSFREKRLPAWAEVAE